jgi:DNA-binding transcriptional MerR regulator
VDKSPEAFRTISEVADHLETPAHVLRFWESRFPQIRPVKRAGGRRYYRPSDVALLTGIKRLLHDEGLTIRGVQKILREHGVRHVAGLSDTQAPFSDIVELEPTIPAAAEEPVEEAIEAPAPVEAAPPQVAAPTQPTLPLFDTPAAALAARPAPRDDVSFAKRIRGLPPGSLSSSKSDVAALARRLAALRDRMADQAEGGRG